MSMKPFLCISYSTILLLQRNHDEVVTTLMVCHRTSSLILALCMTLPSYEGYAGGGRYDAKVVLRKKGREYAWWWRQSIFKGLFENPVGCHLCPREIMSWVTTWWRSGVPRQVCVLFSKWIGLSCDRYSNLTCATTLPLYGKGHYWLPRSILALSPHY